jgi:hypothetical protein
MATRIQKRRDTAANWAAVNPVLAQGEEGLELDTNKEKIGNGTTAWNSLPYKTLGVTPSAIGAATAAQGAKADSAVQPAGLTKAAVGLGNVDNTSDVNKPVSTAQAAALIAHEAAADPHPGYLTAAEGNAVYATVAQGALAVTAIQPGNPALSDPRTPTAHKSSHAVGGSDALSPADIGAVGTSDSRLSDSREWSAPTATEAEAVQGTSMERRAWPPVRVFQAIASWWNGSAAKTKLDGIQDGAQVNVATNLSYDAASREVRSSTGDDATLPLASTTAAGLAPATGTPTGKYLKDDLTWAPVSAAPGGSSGQVQFNNGGTFGGLSTLTADGSGNLTLSARLINAFNAAASAPAKLFSGTWFTGGTSTTTKPHLLIEPAGTSSTHWNTAGTGWGVNGPSNFLGDLAWLGVNGASYARITVSTSNVFLGQSAGQSVTNYTSIVAIGQNAFGSASTAGNGIIAIGAATLRYLSVTNGSTEAVGLGSNAGTRITAATSSVLLGAYAGQGSTAFSARISRTTCAGFEAGAGFDATTLTDNSFFGFRAGFAVSSGNQNTFLGSGAGSTVTTGSNNIAIGFNAALDSITTSNQINIGNVYYHDRITGSKRFTGNVGFYNATPVAQPAAVADATDAASAITQLNALLARLRSLGLIAT